MEAIRFGTDGWRAVMAREFTFDNVALVAQAIADHLHESEIASRGIIVGFDARFLAERFAQLVADVMTANGIRSILPDRDTPTPVIAFTVRDLDLAGAVMLSASHNPPEYNGMKFIPEYCHPALPDVTTAIERHISRHEADRSGVKRSANANLQSVYSPKKRYFEHLHTILDVNALSSSGMRVWYDPLYASGRDYLDAFLREIGVNVEVIHGERNPLFGGSLPDPNAHNLRELAERVVESGATLGFSTDGDADRFGIVGDDGVYLSPNETISLAFWYLLQTRKPERKAVVRTVVTTHLVDAIAVKHGFETIETPVGFKYVGKAIRESGAILGGEESGGFTIYGHIPEKDGIVADLTIAEAVATTGQTCRQMLDGIASEYGRHHSRRVDLHVNSEAKPKLLQTLKETPPARLGEIAVVGVSTLDGVQLRLSDGSWALVRPSGTEPIVRCYAEAFSDHALDGIHSAIAGIIRKVDPNAEPQKH